MKKCKMCAGTELEAVVIEINEKKVDMIQCNGCGTIFL